MVNCINSIQTACLHRPYVIYAVRICSRHFERLWLEHWILPQYAFCGCNTNDSETIDFLFESLDESPAVISTHKL